jgi:chromosome partitioning protein
MILTVVNQKGGVGKTTVALGLASAAARRGSRCVVVDLDPQGNATSGMGVWNPPSDIDKALAADRPGSAVAAAVAAGWECEGFVHQPQVVASSPALVQREVQLTIDPIGAQDRLAVALAGLNADLVIVDCPPSLGLLTVNGLFAADRVAVVTEPGAWATDGVDQIVRNVRRVADRRNGALDFAGIIVNRLGRTRDARYWYDQLVESHGDRVIQPPIRQRAAVAEAAASARPIHALERDGAAEAAAEFDAVLEALLPTVAVVHLPEAVGGWV